MRGLLEMIFLLSLSRSRLPLVGSRSLCALCLCVYVYSPFSHSLVPARRFTLCVAYAIFCSTFHRHRKDKHCWNRTNSCIENKVYFFTLSHIDSFAVDVITFEGLTIDLFGFISFVFIEIKARSNIIFILGPKFEKTTT